VHLFPRANLRDPIRGAALAGVFLLAACGGTTASPATAPASAAPPAASAKPSASAASEVSAKPVASTAASAKPAASAAASAASAAGSAELAAFPPNSVSPVKDVKGPAGGDYVPGTVVATPPAASGPKAITVKPGEKLKVGFLYVGPKNDFGYNYAADQGRQYVEKALPWVDTVYAENVPENAEAERVMEQMIQQGAKIIFPTSYGHLDPASKEAVKHPDVLFLHQGGILDDKTPANVGSYFGEIWEAEYPAGIVAGKMTKSNKLGFIAAFPIPQTLLNINGITLGAKSVNPKAEMHVVFTADWCNPAKQTEAAQSLLDQGVDVISQHQDCPGAIVQSSERRGALSIGYHADASPLAPKTWATAPSWNWGPTYTDLILQAVKGTYKPSTLRSGLDSGVVVLAPFGPAVPTDVKSAATTALADIASGKLKPFTGPLKDQSGVVRIEGEQPDVSKLETMDWLLNGIIGSIPK